MDIPKEVKSVINKLKKKGFEAYVVGGCVRDFLREVEPKDWDVATSAKPEQIQKIFLHPPKFCGAKLGRAGSFYNNRFLTVTVLTCSKNPALKEIEITTYRTEAKYTDKRHPDEISFARTIEEDLSRRDFTVNAIAIGLKSQIPNPKSFTRPNFAKQNLGGQANSKWGPSKAWEGGGRVGVQIPNSKFILIDPFGGQMDLKNKIIRAVRKAEDRFSEDALRMMRAVRFAVTLGKSWEIEPETFRAIEKNGNLLRVISKERIRDELMKIIMSERAASGIELLRKSGLLKYIVPELEEGYGIKQNKHHIYEIYEHNLRCLDYAAKKDYNHYVRLAALLHDIGKPRTKQGDGPDSTFYNHEVVGAKMACQILNRLKFSKKDIEKIAKLVRYHLFYYNVDEVTESSVRRLVREVGPENMEELLQVRYCDRIGSGVPKAEPYKLRHLKYLIERVSRDPISVKTLKVDGNDVMKILGIKPGPKIGWILNVLLGYVLQDPEKNKKEFLEKEIKRMGELSNPDLQELAEKAKKEREKLEMKYDEMTKKKYWVS